MTIPVISASNPSTLSQAAGQLRSKVAQLDTSINAQRQTLSQLSSGWQGAAASAAMAKGTTNLQRVATLRDSLQALHHALSSGGAQLSQLLFPQFAADGDRTQITRAMAASPGAAVGMAVFDSATAQEWAEEGKDVILVRRETNPDDLGGMIAAVGILTARGGKTSHAAVVARGMGRTAVVGAEALDIDMVTRSFTAGQRSTSRS